MKFESQIYFFISCVIPVVTCFSWLNCGDGTQPVKISSLDISSNKTKTLFITGRGKVATNITAPIGGKIDMQKRFFWGWTEIPCVDQVGSCTYTDICELSPYKNAPCPKEFRANDLPCSCPVLEGQYAVKKFPVPLTMLPRWIEEGYYRVKFTLYQNKSEILCLLLNINF